MLCLTPHIRVRATWLIFLLLDTEETGQVPETALSEADDTEDSGGHSMEASWPPVPATWTGIDYNDDQQRLALLLAIITDALEPAATSAAGQPVPAAESHLRRRS